MFEGGGAGRPGAPLPGEINHFRRLKNCCQLAIRSPAADVQEKRVICVFPLKISTNFDFFP